MLVLQSQQFLNKVEKFQAEIKNICEPLVDVGLKFINVMEWCYCSFFLLQLFLLLSHYHVSINIWYFTESLI